MGLAQLGRGRVTPVLAVEIALVAVLLACGALWIVCGVEARIASLEKEHAALTDRVTALQRASVPPTIRRELMTAVRMARTFSSHQ